MYENRDITVDDLKAYLSIIIREMDKVIYSELRVGSELMDSRSGSELIDSRREYQN